MMTRRSHRMRPARTVAFARSRLLACIPGALLVALAATQASAQTVDVYSGTDSAGSEVNISVVEATPVNQIYYFGLGGNRYCDGVLDPGALFGGNTDGTEPYPVIDGRSTFSELRPDFFIQADIRFLGKGRVTGTAVFKQAVYTGSSFPPGDRDTSACTTRQLTFTASYVGSTTLSELSAVRSRRQGRN